MFCIYIIYLYVCTNKLKQLNPAGNVRKNIMKIFRKTSLPVEIIYNGEKYVLDMMISKLMDLSRSNPKVIIERLKRQGKRAILVEVLNNRLKGKTDIYGKPYESTKWIFINN